MPNTRDLRRRIRSIKNTRQITKAMELVSAAKMKKAQDHALKTREYARLAWELLKRASKKGDPRIHKLLRKPEKAKNIGIVLLTSNRGLIGSFNTNVIRTALEYAKRFEKAEFITIGRRGRDAVRKRGYEIAADFEKADVAETVEDVRPLAKLVTHDFVDGKYDQVSLVYMDFISTLAQKPHILELLPLHRTPDKTLGNMGEGETMKPQKSPKYLFEPTADQVLEVLLPRMTIMQVYQALLETNAAEHSARMIAMKNASDNAEELVDDLVLEYNKVRQAAITKEISEIVSGKLALEN